MNRVNSTLFRSSGTRKMLISVLNIRHLRRRAAPEARQLYDSAGAPSAGLAASPSAGAGSAWALDFLGVWRGTNFFLGLGNSNGSPLRFCGVPPASVIFWCAERLYHPATMV